MIKTHGMSETRIYAMWRSMRDRCNNKNHKRYSDYGARGIRVCERWMKFELFIEDMLPGYSQGLTIERSDNDGNYDPSNCKWATRKEQARNTRRNRIEEYNGDSMPVSALAEKYGVSSILVHRRLFGGWDIKRAIEEPLYERRKNTKYK